MNGHAIINETHEKAEPAANFEIGGGDVGCLQMLLNQAIQAKVELDTLVKNISLAAESGLSAKTLLAFPVRPNDLDLYKVAEMLQILALLEPITAGSVAVEDHA